MLELVWRESQVTIHSQLTITDNKPPPSLPPLPSPPSNPPLYVEEDEMASWLHCPFDDIYTDLLYQNLNDPASSTQPPPPQPPSPPSRQLVVARSFQPFSKVAPPLPEQSPSQAGITVVESNESPATMAGGGLGLRSGGGSGSMAYTSSSSATGSETATATMETTPATTVTAEDGIKKGQEIGGLVFTFTEGPSEDTELEVAAKKLKCANVSTSRRSRAAEVHNLSERKRRDRINEKMKALQDLIPHSNKSDKASMLDDAIEYMKSLQLQVQIMTMGCGMVPMMYPGMRPRHVQPTGIVQPTSPQLASMLPPATAYPAPGFSVMRPNSLPNTTNSLIPCQTSVMPQSPNVGINPYQQYMALQPMQMQSQQIQVVQNPSPSQPGASSSKTSTSVTGKEHDDKKDG